MAIQTGEGALRVDPDDLQLTHRGKTIAIKLRVTAYPVILGLVKQANGSWTPDVVLDEDLFSSDVPGEADAVAYWVRTHGGAVGFVRAVILPRLNEWLATLFPPQVIAPPAGDELQQIQAALGVVKLTIGVDGTVTASI